MARSVSSDAECCQNSVKRSHGDPIHVVFEKKSLSRDEFLNHAGLPVKLGIRPEHIVMVTDKKSPLNLTVKVVERLGADTLIHGTLNEGGELVLRLDGICEIESNQILNLSFPGDVIHLFDANTGKRIESE